MGVVFVLILCGGLRLIVTLAGLFTSGRSNPELLFWFGVYIPLGAYAFIEYGAWLVGFHDPIHGFYTTFIHPTPNPYCPHWMPC